MPSTPPVLDRAMQSLIRIQILTPLSILISLGALAIGTFIVRPSMSDISQRHFTYVSPRDSLLLIYWAVLYFAQIGFALFITLASGNEHVKGLISSGVGLRLALANLLLAIWVPLWIVNTHGTFIANTALLSISALGLLFSVLYIQFKADYRPSFRRRPFEWLCVHVPVRLFLVVLLHVDIWQQLLMALRLDGGEGKQALASSTWPVFAIITGASALTSFWIFATTDITWFIASVYLYISILLNRGPSGKRKNDPLEPGKGDKNPIEKIGAERPPEVLAALILAIALQTTAFIASIAWSRLMKRREGRIALPITAEEEAAAEEARRRRLARASANRSHAAAAAEAPTSISRLPADEEEAGEGDALLRGDQQAATEEPTPSHLEQGEGGVHVSRKLGGSKH